MNNEATRKAEDLTENEKRELELLQELEILRLEIQRLNEEIVKRNWGIIEAGVKKSSPAEQEELWNDLQDDINSVEDCMIHFSTLEYLKSKFLIQRR